MQSSSQIITNNKPTPIFYRPDALPASAQMGRGHNKSVSVVEWMTEAASVLAIYHQRLDVTSRIVSDLPLFKASPLWQSQECKQRRYVSGIDIMKN